MEQSPADQNQPSAPIAPDTQAATPSSAPIQPTLTGTPAPEGYTGPWPKPGMDGGDPSSWIQ